MIILFPIFFCPVFHSHDCDGCENDTTLNQTGYHIALYIHAGGYLVSLAFDRYYSDI